jgi:glucose-6-phosphate 1-dehydrogenase
VSVIFRKPLVSPLTAEAPPLGNVLTLDLAGSGSIDLRMVIKAPGPTFSLTSISANLPLAESKDSDPLPPYVKLINDVILGDRSLFTRPDGLQHAWDTITPILDDPPAIEKYARGSWGPDGADALAAPDGWLLGG